MVTDILEVSCKIFVSSLLVESWQVYMGCYIDVGREKEEFGTLTIVETSWCTGGYEQGMEYIPTSAPCRNGGGGGGSQGGV